MVAIRELSGMDAVTDESVCMDAAEPASCSRSVSQDSTMRTRFNGRISAPRLAEVCGCWADAASACCSLE